MCGSCDAPNTRTLGAAFTIAEAHIEHGSALTAIV